MDGGERQSVETQSHRASFNDAAGRIVLTFTIQNGHVTQVADLYGRMVSLTYSGNDLVSVTDVLGNAESYSYDAAHKMVSKTDKNGNTAYVY